MTKVAYALDIIEQMLVAADVEIREHYSIKRLLQSEMQSRPITKYFVYQKNIL
jgi:hypothetical protein